MTSNEMKFNFQLKFDSLFEFSAPAYDDRQISYLLTEAQFRVFIKRYNPLGNKYQKGFEADEQRRRDLEQLIKPATITGLGVSGAIRYKCTWTSATLPTDSVCTILAISGSDLATTIGLMEGQIITGAGIGPSNGEVTPASTNTNVIKSIIDNTHFSVVSKPFAAEGTGVVLYSGIGKSVSQIGAHPHGVFLDMPVDFLYAVEEAANLVSNPVRSTESWIRPVKHDEYLANINNPYKKPYKDLVWRMDISRIQSAEGTSILSSSKRSELILDSTSSLDYYRVRYLATPPSIVVDEFEQDNQRHCVLDETLHREIVDEAVLIAQAAAQKESYQIGVAEQQRSE